MVNDDHNNNHRGENMDKRNLYKTARVIDDNHYFRGFRNLIVAVRHIGNGLYVATVGGDTFIAKEGEHLEAFTL